MNARPRMSTHEKAQENRRQILESAERVFARKGFDGANMREIAAAAGVNKFMLYYHFEDKQTLFDRVLEAISRPVFRKLTDTIDGAASLEQAIGDVYDLYARLFAKNGGRLRSFMAREIAAGAPRASKLFKLRLPEIFDHWAPKIEEDLGRGPLPERQLALAVMNIMVSIVSRFLMQPLLTEVMAAQQLFPADRDVKEQAVQFILGGVRASIGTTVLTQTHN